MVNISGFGSLYFWIYVMWKLAFLNAPKLVSNWLAWYFIYNLFYGMFETLQFAQAEERYLGTCSKSFICWFITILEIFLVEFMVPQLSLNQFQTCEFRTFAITYFLVCFTHRNFAKIEERYLGTSSKNFRCWFAINLEI